MSTDKTEETSTAEPQSAAEPRKAVASQDSAEPQAGRGLKLHHLRPAPGAHKAKTRVGRGEASKGKTAGPRHQGHQGA